MIVTWIIKILAGISGIITLLFFAEKRGENNEKSDAINLLLDDVVTAKKSDSDVDNLSDFDVDKRLRPFEKRKKQSLSNRKPN